MSAQPAQQVSIVAQILLVDDEEDIREILRRYVLQVVPNAHIVEAAGGTDAYYELTTNHYDLLICDVALPDLNGDAMLRSIQDIAPDHLPQNIIFVTGGSAYFDLTGVKATVSKIDKPIDREAFQKHIVHCVGEPKREKSHPVEVPAFDANFLAPFIEGTFAVFETTLNLRPQKDKVFVRKDDQISGDISAVLAINSEHFLGSLAIAFDTECFLGLIENMLGERFTEITPDIQDAAGELCNQIFGQAKKALNLRGHKIQPAIPSVIAGKNHSIKHITSGTCIAVRFKTPQGKFVLETIVSQKRS